MTWLIGVAAARPAPSAAAPVVHGRRLAAGRPRARWRRAALLLPLLLATPMRAAAAMLEQEIAWHATTIAAGDQPFDVIAADLDGDGDIDLACTDSKDSTVSIHLGNGDGSFAPRAVVGTGPFPRGLVAADFNRDGIPDLAVAATNGGGLFVHDGLGGGRFAAGRTFRTGRRPFHAVVADWNGDGRGDIAVANEATNVSILLGDGDGGFLVNSLAAGKWPSNVAAADWNEDGHLDLAATNWGDNAVSVHFGSGDGIHFPQRRDFTYEPARSSLEAPGHSLFGIVAADLDRDGHFDMVWNDIMRSAFWILYGDGSGSFRRTRLVPAAAGIRSLRAADLDGDGWLDLAGADTAAGCVSIALADGHGGFGPTQQVPVGVKPRVVIAADVDGDRRLDLVSANLDSDSLTLLTNQGLAPRASAAFDPGPEQTGRVLELPGLRGPSAAIVDRNGDLLIADQQHHRIVRAARADGALTTIAGTGQPGDLGDGGPAAAARFNLPSALLLDARGNLLVADFENHRIRRIDPSGVVTTVAGTGQAGYAGDGGPATAAQLYRPFSLALAGDGSLYVADLQNGRIRRIDPSGTISTVAGIGTLGTAGDGGAAVAAQIGPVNALAVDAAGNVLIADRLHGRVRRIDRGGTISTVAGQLDQPSAVAVDARGVVYVATANRIARLDGAGAVATVVDLGAARRAGAPLTAPGSLSVAADGSFLVADPSAGTVIRLARDGTVTRLAGNGATVAGR